ncbi:MAG: acyltransferase [Gammaproteobacteria bacterium]|nr:MAG: acyltransferase [Gammaproteobacteria bacterium]
MNKIYDLIVRNKFLINGVGHEIIIPSGTRRSLKKVTLKVRGNNNRLIIGRGTKITNTEIRLDGENNTIELGENCQFKSGKIYLKNGSNKHIRIGNDTTVEGAYLLTDEQANIEIGRDCMLSTEIMIRTGDKHSILDLHSRKRINHAQDIFIHNRVWIGRGALILKGTRLQEETIVGAKSIVTSSFNTANIIIAGCPAKTVKENIYWDRKLL